MKNLSRKEALEILNDMKVKIKIPKAAVMQNKRNAALDMAIEALKCSEIPKSSTDCISRQAAIDAMGRATWAINRINELPSAQPDRDIPVKPNETTDRAWGIPHRQAVCPKCDYYLGHVVFLGDGKGKKVTYCETCGQAIDWEGWDFDE